MKILPEALVFTIAVLCCSSICRVQAADADTTLTLAVFISGINTTGSLGGGEDMGRPFVEAVDLAVQLVNNNTSLLPGYELAYTLTDSQVSKAKSFSYN